MIYEIFYCLTIDYNIELHGSKVKVEILQRLILRYKDYPDATASLKAICCYFFSLAASTYIHTSFKSILNCFDMCMTKSRFFFCISHRIKKKVAHGLSKAFLLELLIGSIPKDNFSICSSSIFKSVMQ